MKNAKNTNVKNNHADAERIVANADAAENDKIMTVADVARELKIDPKRARAYFRKHVDLYVARNQRFTKTSTLYTKTRDALLEYAKSRRVVTD